MKPVHSLNQPLPQRDYLSWAEGSHFDLDTLRDLINSYRANGITRAVIHPAIYDELTRGAAWNTPIVTRRLEVTYQPTGTIPVPEPDDP